MALLSDRAGKTASMVVLPSSLDDPGKSPPGVYRLIVLLTCASISAFFAALVFVYYWRKYSPGVWDQIALPGTLWLSTAIILVSSGFFEAARRMYRKGERLWSARLMLITAGLGMAFLVSQLSAWRVLVGEGAYLSQNPYSSFFYVFTGLHAAHLVGGLIAIGVVVFGNNPRRETVDVAAYYWHFLGVLWIILFIVLSS